MFMQRRQRFQVNMTNPSNNRIPWLLLSLQKTAVFILIFNILVLLFAVPKGVEIFASFDFALPKPTLWLIWFSESIWRYFFYSANVVMIFLLVGAAIGEMMPKFAKVKSQYMPLLWVFTLINFAVSILELLFFFVTLLLPEISLVQDLSS